jgi:hypothetical protein
MEPFARRGAPCHPDEDARPGRKQRPRGSAVWSAGGQSADDPFSAFEITYVLAYPRFLRKRRTAHAMSPSEVVCDQSPGKVVPVKPRGDEFSQQRVDIRRGVLLRDPDCRGVVGFGRHVASVSQHHRAQCVVPQPGGRGNVTGRPRFEVTFRSIQNEISEVILEAAKDRFGGDVVKDVDLYHASSSSTGE